MKAYKVAHFLYPDANIECRDIRTYQPDLRFDYVLGNPPFHLKWWTEEYGEMLSQMYYCMKAARSLKTPWYYGAGCTRFLSGRRFYRREPDQRNGKAIQFSGADSASGRFLFLSGRPEFPHQAAVLAKTEQHGGVERTCLLYGCLIFHTKRIFHRTGSRNYLQKNHPVSQIQPGTK